MKALLLDAPGRLVMTELPQPVPTADEVLVEIKACGICGSDVAGMDGSTGRRIPPIVMGHEAAGIIVETGSAVRGWSVGDRVTFDSTIYCGSCWYCKRNTINLCDRRVVLGVSCAEYRRDGAFAQYLALPQHILYRLPDLVSFEQAAMVEALSIAVHAAKRTPAEKDELAVVVGAGMIGLLLIQVLRLAGYRAIAAIDLDPVKLKLAARAGAEYTLLPDDKEALEQLMKLSDGRGWDRAFEVVGTTASIKTAISGLRKGGSLTLVGNLAPQVEVPLQSLVTREITLYGSCASAGEYPEALEMIAQGQVDLSFMISKVAPLETGAEWFERLRQRERGLMKVILAP